MWKMRVLFDADALPRRRVVMQFRFSDPDLEYSTYWAILQPGAEAERVGLVHRCVDDDQLLIAAGAMAARAALAPRELVG